MFSLLNQSSHSGWCQHSAKTCSGILAWPQFAGYFDTPNYRMLKQDVFKGQYEDTKKAKKELERSMISEVLSQFNGNKKKTAEYLGISRTLLYQKIKEFGF